MQALLTLSQAAVPSAITGDGTLGTTVTQSSTIHTITGGTRPGNGPNLFHSFDRFSVGTGDTARFTGQSGIANILSRVTGGQPSAIDGVLRSEIAGANLFLLNPSGVLFGSNASLNVQGSFHVSTADFVSLADGGTFFANLGQESQLTVALDITVLDLLTGVDFAGEQTDAGLPPGLAELLDDPEYRPEITQDWVRLLGKIQLRGKRPQSKREWLELYLHLKRMLGQ